MYEATVMNSLLGNHRLVNCSAGSMAGSVGLAPGLQHIKRPHMTIYECCSTFHQHNILVIMLNLDVTSLLAQSLLFTTDADFGCRTFIDANEKFISVFVKGLSENQMPRGTTLVNPAAD